MSLKRATGAEAESPWGRQHCSANLQPEFGGGGLQAEASARGTDAVVGAPLACGRIEHDLLDRLRLRRA